MKFSNCIRIGIVSVPLMIFSACGGGQSSSAVSCPAANTSCSSATGSNAIPTSTTASVPVYVADPTTTGQWGYSNEPLVSVTICTPNHTSSTQCQTISNILLDTGSFGLRVFSSAITNSSVQLTQQTVNVQGETMNLAECAVFGTGADWGSVMNGDVLLGSQTATNIPIQVININYASIPSSCSDLCPDTDPCTAGYNGILGVGPFGQDCGVDCANYADDSDNPGNYFGCDSTGCYDAYNGYCGSDGVCVVQTPLNQQVVNPVSEFASGYNNGISLALPSVGASGSSAVTGSMTLGIASSTSAGAVYSADSSGMTDSNGIDFTTTFGGTTYGGSGNTSSVAFLDSGSNAYFFPYSAPGCTENSGFFCPTSTDSLSATIAGYSGSPTYSGSFSLGNADQLFDSSNSAFDNVGANASGMFDWGLPFFYGRTVYVGLDGTSATINGLSATGPYWAF